LAWGSLARRPAALVMTSVSTTAEANNLRMDGTTP
jgi:hypothetical protein